MTLHNDAGNALVLADDDPGPVTEPAALWEEIAKLNERVAWLEEHYINHGHYSRQGTTGGPVDRR